MRVSNIKYNPKLSIAENAKKNSCSIANVRYYIKTHNIDRNYDRKVQLIYNLRAAYIDGDTPSSMQKKAGGSINTIKKYWSVIIGLEDLSDFDRNKHQKVTLRQKQDYYATHPSVTADLLRVETFSNEILEPCCGGGYMADVIKSEGYSVVASDLVDRGYGQGGVDFLTADFPVGKYDIITNPPYTNVSAFIKKALEICNRKVAILMPLRYLSSMERFETLYRENPPKHVYCYMNRITIAKNGEFEKYEAGMNLEIYAWYIWEKGYNGETILKWINNKI
jgi:hypothetical protein